MPKAKSALIFPLKLLGMVIEILSWFIRIVSFIGDVAIWTIKQFFRAFIIPLKKAHIDLVKIAPIRLVRKLVHHPIIYQEINF